MTVALSDGTVAKCGRQGDQERGGLRPRQAVHRRATGRSGRSSQVSVRLHPLPADDGHRGRARPTIPRRSLAAAARS
ncbi:MAG: hypothetical protein WKF40_00830 [Thermoleophilaceae bacterium]